MDTIDDVTVDGEGERKKGRASLQVTALVELEEDGTQDDEDTAMCLCG